MEQNLHDMNDSFEQKIKEKIAHTSLTPPSHLWSNISAELNRQDAHSTGSSPAVPTFSKVWKYGIAASVIFLLGFGVAIRFFSNDTATGNIAVKNNDSPTVQPPVENIVSAPVADNLLPQPRIVKHKKRKAVPTKQQSETAAVPTVAATVAEKRMEISPEAIQPINASVEKQENIALPVLAPVYSAKIVEKEIITDEIKVLGDTNDNAPQKKNKAVAIDRKNKKAAIDYVLPWRF